MKRVVAWWIPLALAFGWHYGLSAQAEYGAGPAPASERQAQYLFGWGFEDAEAALPRGGTTRGTEVELAPERIPLELRERSDFERDRAAILSFAGDYRISFHFVETLAVTENGPDKRPYFSWATERIEVLEERENFISLQHTMVMFFADGEQNREGPAVMKHWRQDWAYEQPEHFVYQGNGTWEREKRDVESVAGAWRQAVFQVDDSPRYEVLGRWEHHGNFSRWVSERDARPLPRRESSIRDDYDVLEGRHQLVLTPTGWVHLQDNWKRASEEAGGAQGTYLAHEFGINRYERITAPNLGAAREYWEKTGSYWAAVRRVWEEVMAERDSFTLKSRVDGRALFEEHFAFAAELEAGQPYDPAEGERHARETILKFLATD